MKDVNADKKGAMMKMIIKRKDLLIIMSLVVTMFLLPVVSFATPKTQNLKTYSEVIKVKNIVYCCGMTGIYKVTIKNKKPIKVKRITSMPEGNTVISMNKKGNYIYYQQETPGTMYYLYKVKTNGSSEIMLLSHNDGSFDFAVKGKKIYYSFGSSKHRQMNLNGKSKKRASVHPVYKTVKSNAKGYKVVFKTKGRYIKEYLKTPKGKIYLGKKLSMFW